MSPEQKRQFYNDLWQYYDAHGRSDLPWRQPEVTGNFDPYKMLVSELMLQQTQVGRVIPKYDEFLARFPDLQSLAVAPLGEVLTTWSGLGYNRRAKYLHQAAQALVSKAFPWQYGDLVACKGIGPNTAAAILVYSYNQPLVFVETNIRTVHIYHFFAEEANPVSDKQIVGLLGKTLDSDDPRAFYWALMDYGSHLKKEQGNNISRSKQYVRQLPFHGSLRQVRGQVIRTLTGGPRSLGQLRDIISDDRLQAVLKTLEAEGLIVQAKGLYRL